MQIKQDKSAMMVLYHSTENYGIGLFIMKKPKTNFKDVALNQDVGQYR